MVQKATVKALNFGLLLSEGLVIIKTRPAEKTKKLKVVEKYSSFANSVLFIFGT
jgi:hypothetical protein